MESKASNAPNFVKQGTAILFLGQPAPFRVCAKRRSPVGGLSSCRTTDGLFAVRRYLSAIDWSRLLVNLTDTVSERLTKTYLCHLVSFSFTKQLIREHQTQHVADANI